MPSRRFVAAPVPVAIFVAALAAGVLLAGCVPDVADENKGLSFLFPGPPTQVQAIGGPASVLLTWHANTTGTPADSYHVDDVTGGNAVRLQTVPAGGGSTFQFQTPGTLPPGLYSYRIAGANPAGREGEPATASAVVSITIPDAPTGVLLTVDGEDQITIDWSAGAGNGAAPDHYQVFRATGAGAFGPGQDTAGLTTTFTDAGLSPGTRYRYQVAAVTVDGQVSQPSTDDAQRSTLASPPSAITVIGVAVDTVTIDWTAPAGQVVTGYQAANVDAAARATTGAPAGTSASDSGLGACQTHNYAITSLNEDGVPGNAATAGAPTLCDPPSSFLAAPGDQQVALAWDAMPGAASYNVTTMNGAAQVGAVLNTTSSSITVTGLTNGTAYDFLVTTVNSAGLEGAAGTASATPVSSTVAAPASLAATPADTAVALTWPAVSGAVDHYNVYRAAAAGQEAVGTATPIGAPTTNSFTDSTVTPFQTYYYVVTAVSTAALESAASPEAVAIPFGPLNFTPPALPFFFAYEVSQDNTVSAFVADAATGQLRNNGYVLSGAATGTPISMTVSPTGRFAYTTNSNVNTVSAFSINGTTGRLSTVSPGGTGLSNPRSIAVDPAERFAYVANSASGTISAFSIDPTTGALANVPGSPFTAGPLVQFVAVDRTGQYVYAVDNNRSIFGFKIGPDGGLTALSGFPLLEAVGSGPLAIAVDPAARFLYVANATSGTVSSYAVDAATGQLNPVAADISTGGASPSAIAVDPSGSFVYVANTASNTVAAFAIQGTGALTPVGTNASTGGSPGSVTVDPTGSYVYTTNKTGNSITVLVIAVDGSLTAVPAEASAVNTRPTPQSVVLAVPPAAVSFGPKSLYTAFSANNAFEYQLDGGGNLSGQTSFSAGGLTLSSVLADPLGRFLYFSDSAAGRLGTLQLHADGTVGIVLSSVATAGVPVSFAPEPSGRFVYLAASSASAIEIFSVNGSGSLSLVSTSGALLTSVSQVAVDPSGQYLYAIGTPGLQAYSISSVNGSLTAHGSLISVGTGINDMAVDPSGRALFVAATSGIRAYAIDNTNLGTLTALNGGAPFTAGVTNGALVAAPSARYLYVVDSGTDQLYVFNASLTPPFGSLSPIAGSPVALTGGSAPLDVAIDPSGGILITADSGTNALSAFSIDANGLPSLIGQTPAGVAPQVVNILGGLQ